MTREMVGRRRKMEDRIFKIFSTQSSTEFHRVRTLQEKCFPKLCVTLCNSVLKIPFFCLLLSIPACSINKPQTPEVKTIVLEQPADIPPGVVRYCWEEPIAKFERNGPGLDSEGRWYHPSYIAAREIRMGKWRPCKPEVSETHGGNKDGH